LYKCIFITSNEGIISIKGCYLFYLIEIKPISKIYFIYYEEEDKKTIKALIVTIKDEGLQDNRLERFEACISAIIDATTLSDDQLDDLIPQMKELFQ
jgi:hypothetical protein